MLKDEHNFPDEYPARGTEITVAGIFDAYMEDMNATLSLFTILPTVMEGMFHQMQRYCFSASIVVH